MSQERSRTRLGEALEVPVGEARLARGWQAVAARAYGAPVASRMPSRRPLYFVAAGVTAAAAAIALLTLAPGAEETGRGPLAMVSPAGEPAVSVEAALGSAGHAGSSVALDDGSVIQVAQGAELEALENSGERFSLLLRAGRAHFDVRPGGGRRWTIEAGLVTVEVVGTAFEVVRDEAGVRVAVERGRVLVRGDAVPDRVRSLGAGESIRVDARDVIEAAATEAEPSGEAVASAARAAESEIVRSAEAVPDVEATLAPRRPVRSRHGEATGGAPERGSAEPSAASLLAQADEARRAGRVDEALGRLSEAARREGDPDAALASLTRGRLALEHGRAGEAVRDLRRAIAVGLPSRLEELARARLVEALARSGDREGATRAADEYLRAHPEGAWRDAVTRAVSEQ